MSIAIILAGAVLVIDSRLRSALVAYVIFTLSVLWMSHPHGHEATATGIALFSILAFIKIVVGPSAILWLRLHHRVPDDLAPSFNLGIRVAVAALALYLAQYFSHAQAFTSAPGGTIVFYAFFSSICIVILHRNLLAHVVGLLALGSAVTLAAAVFAPSLPGAIELADTFDAIFATFIAIAVARAVILHDPRLDMRSLRDLRG
ncbi:MAG: hypothetical protein ACYDGM_02405 [Vulcanimicrobiaceae bacterium]